MVVVVLFTEVAMVTKKRCCCCLSEFEDESPGIGGVFLKQAVAAGICPRCTQNHGVHHGVSSFSAAHIVDSFRTRSMALPTEIGSIPPA